MAVNISAELISIGTEILLGEITDTNSVFMARALRDIGVNVFYIVSVGDNEGRIADTVRTSLARSDVVITCGGLGPTVDDMTRQSVAHATDRELVFHPPLLDEITARFEKYRVEMTENNRRQAYLPTEAIVIENPVGTAPAFIVEVGEKCVISLPGVPREMKYLFNERVIPYLRARYHITEQVILARILKTAGIGESSLDTLIGTEILEAANPTVGLAAHSGQIDVRITAKADTLSGAKDLIAPVELALRERIGGHIFGADEDNLEEIFAGLLRERHNTLSLSETGTGGVISERLSPAMGDLIVATEAHATPSDLRAAYGLPEDTPLQAMAEHAATALREQSGSTVCIAVVSRPDVLENPDKEAGTAVVVCTADKLRHRVYGFGGQSDDMSRFVGNWSTAIAWQLVREIVDGA